MLWGDAPIRHVADEVSDANGGSLGRPHLLVVGPALTTFGPARLGTRATPSEGFHPRPQRGCREPIHQQAHDGRGALPPEKEDGSRQKAPDYPDKSALAK